MWYKNVGTRFFRFVTIYAFDRQTHGQTDIRHTDISLGKKCTADVIDGTNSLEKIS